MNGWACPVCHRSSFWVRVSDVYWATHGGGIGVCRKCARERREEIEAHNEIYYGNPNKHKDPSCDHKWLHPYPGRYYCPKCGAEYNFMCSCGGSAYVCPAHYAAFLSKAVLEFGSVEAFLAERSW